MIVQVWAGIVLCDAERDSARRTSWPPLRWMPLRLVMLAFLALLGSAALVPGQTAYAVESMLGPEIDIGVEARGFAVDPGLKRIYVAHTGGVLVLDSVTRATLGNITGLSGPPADVAVNLNTHAVFVAFYAGIVNGNPLLNGNTVDMIDGTAGSFGQRTRGWTFGSPVAWPTLVVDPDTNSVWIMTENGNSLVQIDVNANSFSGHGTTGCHQPSDMAILRAPSQDTKLAVACLNDKIVDIYNVQNAFTYERTKTLPVRPVSVAYSASDLIIYAAGDDGSLQRIRAGTWQVMPALSLGGTLGEIAVSPNGPRTYVARYSDNSVAVLHNDVVQPPVPAGTHPLRIAVDPTTGFVYVANAGSQHISILGTPYLAETATDGGDIGTTSATAMAANPATNRVYVTDSTQGKVTVFDGTTLQQVAGSPISVSGGPTYLDVDTVSNRIYVGQQSGGSVAVIDGATNTLLGSINLGTNSAPAGVAVNSQRHLVYVNRQSPNGVTVIDGAAGAFGAATTTITTGIVDKPRLITLNPETRRLYLSYVGGGASATLLTIVNTATNTVSTTGEADFFNTLRVNPRTNRLFAEYAGVSMYNVDGDAVALLSQLPDIFRGSYAMSLNPATNRLYLSAFNYVTIVDGRSPTFVGSGMPVPRPFAIATNPSTNRTFVASLSDSKLRAIGPTYRAQVNGGNVTGLAPGSTVQVSWDGLVGMNGADRIGLFPAGVVSTGSPLSQTFTNGGGSAGGNGVVQGTVNLAIPASLAAGSYEIRFISGFTAEPIASLQFKGPAKPVAVADSYTTTCCAPLNVVATDGLLKNDTDEDTQTSSLTASVVTQPTSGTLTLQPNGAFAYTPPTGFSGQATFTYKVTDPDSLVSNTATVTIIINAAPVTPVTPVPPVTPVTPVTTVSACNPRPNVSATSIVSGGALQVTVTTATDASGLVPGRMVSIQFGQMVNGTVTMNGQQLTSGQTVTLPANTTSTTFTVRRVTPGQATTVPITVVDGCGEWKTFVGGGTGAGF